MSSRNKSLNQTKNGKLKSINDLNEIAMSTDNLREIAMSTDDLCEIAMSINDLHEIVMSIDDLREIDLGGLTEFVPLLVAAEIIVDF